VWFKLGPTGWRDGHFSAVLPELTPDPNQLHESGKKEKGHVLSGGKFYLFLTIVFLILGFSGLAARSRCKFQNSVFYLP